MHKPLFIIIGGSIIVIVIIVLGIYFLSPSNSTDLFERRDTLQGDIAKAQARLNSQKGTLDSMTNDLLKSFPLGGSVQDHMRKSGEIVQETNFMFTDAEGSNPELILKNISVSTLINEKRRNVNLLLSEWQKKLGVSSISQITLAQSQKVKQDTALIRSFVKDLSDLIANLTPETSGLSQSEIDAFLAELPSVGAVDEILAKLEVAIDVASGSTSSSTSLTQSVTSTPSSTSVTTREVVAQQNIVQETQNEVAALQQELAVVEQQIAQTSTTTTTTTTTNTTPTTNTTTTTSTTKYTPPPKRVIVPSTGIIVQPGPPQLIPGIDDH